MQNQRKEFSRVKAELKEMVKAEGTVAADLAEDEDILKNADAMVWAALNEDEEAFRWVYGTVPEDLKSKHMERARQEDSEVAAPHIGLGFRFNPLLRVTAEAPAPEADVLSNDSTFGEKEDQDVKDLLAEDDSLLTWEEFITDDSPEYTVRNRLYHVNLSFPMEADMLVYKYTDERAAYGSQPLVKGTIDAARFPPVNYTFQEPLPAHVAEPIISVTGGEEVMEGNKASDSNEEVAALRLMLQKLEEERDTWKSKYEALAGRK